MKYLNCVIENFAFDVYFEDGDENDLKEKALFLVFKNGSLEVFPTIFLSSIDEKIVLLDSFLNGDTNDRTLKSALTNNQPLLISTISIR